MFSADSESDHIDDEYGDPGETFVPVQEVSTLSMHLASQNPPSENIDSAE